MDTAEDASGDNIRAKVVEYNGGDILLAEPTAAFSKALPYILDYISGKGLTAGSVSGTIYD